MQIHGDNDQPSSQLLVIGQASPSESRLEEAGENDAENQGEAFADGAGALRNLADDYAAAGVGEDGDEAGERRRRGVEWRFLGVLELFRGFLICTASAREGSFFAQRGAASFAQAFLALFAGRHDGSAQRAARLVC